MDYDEARCAKRPELRVVPRLPRLQPPAASDSSRILHAGDLTLDVHRHLLWKANKEIHLSPKAFDLLSCLFKSQGDLVTHIKLLRTVWGPEDGNRLNTCGPTSGCFAIRSKMTRLVRSTS
jgi:DNA-binding response OmpR family regulator